MRFFLHCKIAKIPTQNRRLPKNITIQRGFNINFSNFTSFISYSLYNLILFHILYHKKAMQQSIAFLFYKYVFKMQINSNSLWLCSKTRPYRKASKVRLPADKL